METSTKVLLATGLATLGLSLYAKQSKGSYNPLALFGPATATTGPALPAKTPVVTLPAGATTAPPPPVTSASNTPEVNAALSALQSIPASFPNTPEVAAAVSTLQGVPPNSPEAQAALGTLAALPNSPEAAAAIAILQGIPAGGLAAPVSPSSPFGPPGNGPLISNGDVVDVDMFRSGMSVPQNIPAVGLIFMNVDSLESPGDQTKFLGSFVSPEFRVLGPQVVNRAAIVSKA